MAVGDMISQCKECGAQFSISAKEQEWFESRSLALPKRCPECRKKRRKEKEAKMNGGSN